MDAYDPRSLMIEVIELIYDANNVASRMLKNAHGVFVMNLQPQINFSQPELGFLQTVCWLYILYYKHGPVGVEFLSERFPAYGLDGEGIGKSHVSIVQHLRTFLQYLLDPTEEMNSRVQEICDQWFEHQCKTQVPRETAQWQQCFVGILGEAIGFLTALRDCVRKIEQDESRNQIVLSWQLRLKRYHSPQAFDELISLVAADIGQENLDVVSLRKRFYDTWTKKLKLHQGNYELAMEGRKLIEHVLLNEMIPTLPVTGKDLLEAFSLTPGPAVGALLREARILFEIAPCSRDDLLERLSHKENIGTVSFSHTIEMSKGEFAMGSSSMPACVAFQGGGALGMAHLGAWQVLAQRFQIVGTAGTSAGSIVAALCAAGYDPYHAIELFDRLEWPEYVKPQRWLDLFRKRDGWSDGERFYQWMKDRLATRVSHQPQHVTFASLYEETAIYLAVIACDLNNQTAQPVLFDKENEADTSVAFAVRASISIPAFFTAVPRRDRGQILVDGGLLLNLPLKPLHTLAQHKRCPLIGVHFKQPMAYLDAPDISDVLKRSLNVMIMPGSVPSPEVMQDPNYIDIVIDVTGFNSLNFKLTPQEKKQLVQRGAQAAREALLQYELRIARSTSPLASTISSSQEEEIVTQRRPQTAPQAQAIGQSPTLDSQEPSKVSSPEASRNLQKRLSFKDRNALAQRLLKCPSVKDPGSWEAVVGELPDYIRDARKKLPRHDIDVRSTIGTCENYPGGLKNLIDIVRSNDGETFQMRDVDDVLRLVLPGFLES